MKNIFFYTFLCVTVLLAACSSDSSDSGPDPSVDLSTNSITLSNSSSASRTINFTANYSWTSSVSAGAESWVTVSPSSGKAGTTEVIIDLAENTNEGGRNATVTFTLNDDGHTTTHVSISQSGYATLEVAPGNLTVGPESQDIELTVTGNVENLNVQIISDEAETWIVRTQTRDVSNTLHFSVSPNFASTTRNATIRVSNGDRTVSADAVITQQAFGATLTDGSYLQLYSATVGRGVNLVLMGDGYTQEEINSGAYAKHMAETMDFFFSVYPYSEYKNHFNVWMVVGVSNESGVSTGSVRKDTKFDSHIINPNQSTGIECDYDMVARYISYIPGMPDSWYHMGDITSIVILNSSEYAGTCAMYGNGFSVCMCPRIDNGDSRPNYGMSAVVIHESGGHGFGRLADEYVASNGTISQDEIDDARDFQSTGGMMNVDYTNDLSWILWKDFLQHDKYTDPSKVAYQTIGAYEGADYYRYGVWRPELNSCMIDNIDYYNGPSRWAIVKRIKEIAGLSYSFDQFVADDNPPPPSYQPTRSANMVEEQRMPFAPPIRIEM